MSGGLLDDLRRLRGSLLLALAMLLAGIAVAAYSARWHARERAAVATLQAQQRSVKAQLSRAHQEVAEIDARIALFERLRARRVIGAETRLDWVEAIEDLKRRIGMPRLEYELLPQRTMELRAGDPPPSGYRFVVSTMRLRMTLLHEGDLLDLLEQLPGRVGAILRLRSCEVERNKMTNQTDARSGLNAECMLDWITLAPQGTGASR